MENEPKNPKQHSSENLKEEIPHKLTAEDINKIEQYRQTRKTSVLTILFTDIVGYTDFTYKAGEKTSAKFRHIHDEIIISQIKKDGHGEIIKQIGDSFLIVFSDPTIAVKQALILQELFRVNAENLTHKAYQLKIRIGLHMGQVSVEDHIMPDVFGTHVNLASRVMGLAKGGQVIVSGSVWENASGWLKEGNEQSVYYGKIKLKGIGKSTEIYEFYTESVGRKGMPKIIVKSKQKRILAIGSLILIIGLMVVILIIYLSRSNTNKVIENIEVGKETILLADIKSYYEDLENLKQLEDNENYILDSFNLIESIDPQTIELINEKYFEQLKTSYIIDYDIITEQEIKNEYAKKGLNLTHDIKSDTNLPKEYYQIIIPHLYKFKELEKYLLIIEMWGTSSDLKIIKDIDSVPILIEKYSTHTLKWLESYEYAPGTITSINGNDVIITFWDEDKIPNPGLIFKSIRYYKHYKNISDEGVQRKLAELKLARDYYNSDQSWIDDVDTADYNWSYAEYRDLTNGYIKKKTKHEILGLDPGILYKIIEVFDSTALVKVHSKKYPFLIPEIDDKVHLK